MIVSSGARFRGVAAAATVGLVALAVVAAPAASAAAPGSIHPGVVTESDGGGACTSNFIFTNGKQTFLGQAAHCAGTGAATETNGCDSASGPIGTPVVIKAGDGTDRMGTLAYSSWLTMQAAGETDPDACKYNDIALVEISKADAADVDSSIPHFGGPNGINTGGLVDQEKVYSYGNSPVRQGISTLSPKTGFSAGDAGNGWSHTVYTVSPGVPGDSGSAFLDAEGNALGVLATLDLAPTPLSNGVGDLNKELAYINAHGDLGKVELVLGTAPFHA